MRLSFNGTYPMTRPFGVYDPAYANYPGSRHPGTDWGLPANTPLVAGMSGTVAVFNRGTAKIGRGNEVVITNIDKQRKTCHMNRLDVVTGQQVTEGQLIGLSGYTGYVVDAQGNIGTPAGAHLHDELLINGQYIDLVIYLKGEPRMAIITKEAVIAMSLGMRGDQPHNETETKFIGKTADQKTLDDFITFWVDRSRISSLEKRIAELENQVASSEFVPVTETLYRRK